MKKGLFLFLISLLLVACANKPTTPQKTFLELTANGDSVFFQNSYVGGDANTFEKGIGTEFLIDTSKYGVDESGVISVDGLFSKTFYVWKDSTNVKMWEFMAIYDNFKNKMLLDSVYCVMLDELANIFGVVSDREDKKIKSTKQNNYSAYLIKYEDSIQMEIVNNN